MADAIETVEAQGLRFHLMKDAPKDGSHVYLILKDANGLFQSLSLYRWQTERQPASWVSVPRGLEPTVAAIIGWTFEPHRRGEEDGA